jgi:hypothetical protein
LYVSGSGASDRIGQIRVELDISDEIVEIKRRRVGRGRRWDSTTSWPPGRRDEVYNLVAHNHGPAPALHEVSSIVRPPSG